MATLDHARGKGALALLRLASPALPIGAYAGSEALEYAVEIGWVHDESSAAAWIGGRLEHGVVGLDLPLLKRHYLAFVGPEGDVQPWAEFLRASRETAELWAQENSLGRSLARLLRDLGVECATPWVDGDLSSYIGQFALAAFSWGMEVEDAGLGYAYAWSEAQVAAAIKLVPLGHTAGQRILGSLLDRIPDCIERGFALSDDEIGASEVGLAIASCRHETQHTRLFRS